jgi:prophage regulatory protein
MQAIEASTRRILRLPEIIKITGFSKSWIYELMATRDFPQSTKIGRRSVGWDSHEITIWVNRQFSSDN